MHEVGFDLLILLGAIWLVAVTLRPLGLPTVMGELIVGVLLGPAVFGLTDGDDLYVCGTVDAFNRFYEEFAVTFETS